MKAHGQRRAGRAVLLAAIAAALAVLSAAVAAAGGSDPRPGTVTRGLDYLHARQGATGGFGSPEGTAWAVLGATASGERVGNSAWTVGGKDPFAYLQATNHDQAAAAESVANPVVYYARMVMAYVAAGQRERVFVAGTPRVDLLARLYGYQDLAEDSPTRGSFSPSSSSRQFQAVVTTAWAMLAMRAVGDDGGQRYELAARWLAGQQADGGGFASEHGEDPDVVTTALVTQALARAPEGSVPDGVLAAARSYLAAAQNADAGFPARPGGRTSSEATAAAVQAILALGEAPTDETWKKGEATPLTALARLQRATGAYRLTSRSDARPLVTTSWALCALRQRSFADFPRQLGTAVSAFRARPVVRRLEPADGARYTTTRIVLLSATYTDLAPKGTGIKPSACRVTVDGVDRTRQADVGRTRLTLRLENLVNGGHTWKVDIADRAGNHTVRERTFTVAVPVPAPYPTSHPTGVAPPPTRPPTPSRTLTPTSPSWTLTPTPTWSPGGSGSPSPSGSGLPVTGTPIPSASGGGAGVPGGGSGAGAVGGTLLAVLPVGALVAYLMLHRRAQQLAAASEGVVLSGGGSAWERLSRRLRGARAASAPRQRE